MRNRSSTIIIGIVIGLVLAAAAVVWWQGTSDYSERVRRTVITTIEDESPASFLVTGTLEMSVSVRVDTAQFLTPDWLTFVLRQTQPGALPLLKGGSQAHVQVPGTVSYGFDVWTLTPSMISVGEDGLVEVRLPTLSIHSVAPDLARVAVQTQSRGWMRLLPSDAPETVRKEALRAVEGAFRAQAQRRLRSATQPRVNTARALETMLRPSLEAVGVSSPEFRIRLAEDLVLQPERSE